MFRVINLSRLSDLFVGHMKAFVLVLNAGCVVTSYWFIIVAQQYVHFSKGDNTDIVCYIFIINNSE